MNSRNEAITADTAQNEQPQQLGVSLFSGRSSFQSGGLTTNSPPAKVKLQGFEPYQILASGIDTLHLAIDVSWRDCVFFEFLEEKKGLAKESREEVPIYLTCENSNVSFPFMVKPSGTGGYEWLLEANDMTMKIASTLRPTSRPSVHVELRSEFLWRNGLEGAILHVVDLLMGQGGTKIVVSPSRADFCIDMLMPEAHWALNLMYGAVGRARKVDPHFDKRNWSLTGFSIGKGGLLARIYDKPLEIKTQSRKFWMYDVWGIERAPKGFRIIRIEFQGRREVLVQLGAKSLEEFLRGVDNVWGYYTQKWLKFKDHPEKKHHTQRRTLPWWQAVQNGFLGVQDPTPAIRAKALNAKSEDLLRQAYGLLTSAAAIQLEKDKAGLHESANLLSVLEATLADPKNHPRIFSENVQKKRVKYHRQTATYDAKNQLRKSLGLPHG